MRPISSLDELVFLFINDALSGPLLTPLFALVTRLGDGLVLALLILPAIYLRDRKRLRHHGLGIVVTVALSGGVVNLAKIAIDRDRPPNHFAEKGVDVHVSGPVPSDRSFPSGHSQTAFGAAVYLCFLYPLGTPIFLALATGVGLSRIALGVHFPLDVLAGAATGAAFSWVGYLFFERRRRSATARPPARGA